MASQGVASRRKCEELISQGKVSVNGKVVTELGTKIDPETDEVVCNGKKAESGAKEHIYILLNKPIGVVTTAKEQFGRPTVLELVKVSERIVPVGRLDMYTSGALLLTNDGDFVYKFTHPKHEIPKTYQVTVHGVVTKENIETLEKGVKIGDYQTSPAKARILKIDNEKNISRIEITIHEGKNRQIRKMCEALDLKVMALHRSKIGNITVKDLKMGKWRYLTEKEIKII